MAFTVVDNFIYYADDANDYYFPYGANVQTPPDKRIHTVPLIGSVVVCNQAIWDGSTGSPASYKATLRYVDGGGVARVLWALYLTNSHAGQRTATAMFGDVFEVRGYLEFAAAHNATPIEIFTYLA